MKCWHCGTELIWGGDHDYDMGEDFDIVTNLSCPNCETHVEVYHKIEGVDNEREEACKRKKP